MDVGVRGVELGLGFCVAIDTPDSGKRRGRAPRGTGKQVNTHLAVFLVFLRGVRHAGRGGACAGKPRESQ